METQLSKILGRSLHADLVNSTSNSRILVTGGNGSVGQKLKERCPNAVITDINEVDVTNITKVNDFVRKNAPFDYVIHLAGDKHAPKGEETPFNTLDINTHGIQNLIICLPNAHHVLASTCKACNPETVYGATKLISERLILNNGGAVARFYNVVETQGNVFEIWKNGPKEVYTCHRFFIGIDEAVGLLIECLNLKGRFAVNPGKIRSMVDIFNSLGYKGPVKERRKGDRQCELLHSTSETITPHGSLLKITSYHDSN